MSLVYITEHNETIYEVDKRTVREKLFELNFTSRHHKRARTLQKGAMNIKTLADGKKLMTINNKFPHRTMGEPMVPLKGPKEFLRKGEGIKWMRQPLHRCVPTNKELHQLPHFTFVKPKEQSLQAKPKPEAPPLTRREEVRLKKLKKHSRPHKHRDDFMQKNIVNLENMTARPIMPRICVSPKGEVKNLMDTVLVPQHICSKTFGKVPSYLKQHKAQLAEWQQLCKTKQPTFKKVRITPACRPYVDAEPLTDEERQLLIKGLRTNLAEQERIYLCSPICTDTPGKAARKRYMEKQLRELEQYLYVLEHNPVIYITDI